MSVVSLIQNVFSYDEPEMRFVGRAGFQYEQLRTQLYNLSLDSLDLGQLIHGRPLSSWLLDLILLRDHFDSSVVMQALIAHPTFDWNKPSQHPSEAGKTPLHFYMEGLANHNQRASEFLPPLLEIQTLNWGADITYCWLAGWTPLHGYMAAVTNGVPQALNGLSSLVQNPNMSWNAQVLSTKQTPLMMLSQLAKQGNRHVLSAVRQLAEHAHLNWDENDGSPERKGPTARTFLQQASDAGFSPAFQALQALGSRDMPPPLDLGDVHPDAPATPKMRRSPISKSEIG